MRMNELHIHTVTWENLTNKMMKERSQTLKKTYHMIPCTVYKAQYGQNESNAARNWNSRYLSETRLRGSSCRGCQYVLYLNPLYKYVHL